MERSLQLKQKQLCPKVLCGEGKGHVPGSAMGGGCSGRLSGAKDLWRGRPWRSRRTVASPTQNVRPQVPQAVREHITLGSCFTPEKQRRPITLPGKNMNEVLSGLSPDKSITWSLAPFRLCLSPSHKWSLMSCEGVEPHNSDHLYPGSQPQTTLGTWAHRSSCLHPLPFQVFFALTCHHWNPGLISSSCPDCTKSVLYCRVGSG